jgi:hypothetical protein
MNKDVIQNIVVSAILLGMSGYISKMDSKVESNTHQIDTHIESSNQAINGIKGSLEKKWDFSDAEKEKELDYKIDVAEKIGALQAEVKHLKETK